YLPGDLDTIFAAPGAFALLIAVALVKKSGRKRDAFDVAAFFVALFYLVAPADLALGDHRISLLGPRLLVAAWLFAIAAGPPKLPLALRVAPLASALALSVLLAITAHRFGEAWGPEIARAVESLPPNARMKIDLAPPRGSPLNTQLVGPPELHFHAF